MAAKRTPRAKPAVPAPTASRVLDYDAVRSQRPIEPLVLVIGGVKYELPGAMPAAVLLDYMEIAEVPGRKSTNISAEETLRILRSLFGSELLAVVLDRHRITTRELPDLFRRLFDEYMKPLAQRAAKAVAEPVEE